MGRISTNPGADPLRTVDMTLRPVLSLLLVLGLLAGCGADGAGTAAPFDRTPSEPATVAITIERSRFDTPELVVPVDTMVTFVNEDAFAHRVTSVDGVPVEFDSGDLAEDAVFEITFDRPGSYAYFCEIHPTMRGTVGVG